MERRAIPRVGHQAILPTLVIRGPKGLVISIGEKTPESSNPGILLLSDLPYVHSSRWAQSIMMQ